MLCAKPRPLLEALPREGCATYFESMRNGKAFYTVSFSPGIDGSEPKAAEAEVIKLKYGSRL